MSALAAAVVLRLLAAGAADAASAPVRLNAGTFVPRSGASAPSGAAAAASGKELRLVQLSGPTTPAAYAALKGARAEVVDFVPEHTYVVRVDAAAKALLAGLTRTNAAFRWEGPFAAEQKVHRKLAGAAGEVTVALQLVRDEAENAATLALLDRLRPGGMKASFPVLGFLDVVARVPASALLEVAARPDALSIQPWSEPVKLDEGQARIVSGQLSGSVPSPGDHLAWLASQGFTQAQFDASAFVVDVTDSGIDNGTTGASHAALRAGGIPAGASRIAYARLIGTPSPDSSLAGCEGHGAVSAHVLAGYDGATTGAERVDASGFRYGLGVCPFVKVGSSVIFDPYAYTVPRYDTLTSRAYQDGARISSNSWGFLHGGEYDLTAQAYDALVRDAQPAGSTFPTAGDQPLVVVAAAGNGGPGGTVVSPGAAKNVLTVGASESVRAFGGADQCGVGDDLADSAGDLLPSSSRGPTADGRKKPDLVAAGSHVTGGIPQAASPAPTGTALACYAANTSATLAVCGGPGSFPSALYFPSGQQLWSASSGTSVSAPAVAGAAALLRQRFLNAALAPPSPAMTKALLLNAARGLSGAGAGDPLWSDGQGMGALDVGAALDRVGGTLATLLRDQDGADTFTASGQSRTYTGVVADPGRPFRVTLSWTDAPGSTIGAAYKNDLDLSVTVGGVVYRGNVFSGSLSASGGTADRKNNVESVLLPAGLSGTFSVTVSAYDVNSDGVPGSGGPLDQDFALVVANASASAQAVVLASASAVSAESCAPANAAVDPAETVTVDLALANVGAAGTTDLVATLLPAGGVTSPSAPQSYGALAAGSPAVARPFTFTAAGSCGGVVTATLELFDGATPLGNAVFSFRLGTAAAPLTVAYAGPAVAIPDGSPGGVSIPVTVSGFTGVVLDVGVSFDGSACSSAAGATTVGLDHTYVGDLTATLTSPLGTTVTLFARPGPSPTGSSGNNLCNTVLDDEGGGPPIQSIAAAGAPYTGTFTPASPLSAFAGEDPNGTWTLKVVDSAAGQTGSVRAFSIGLSRNGCCGAPCVPPLPPVASSNSPVGEGDTLLLAASTVPGATYQWSGPSGFASSAQNPVVPNVTALSAGTYSVTASVASCPSVPATTDVTVLPAVPAGFYTVAPCRVADTRDPDGPWGGPRLSGDGATRDFVVGGRCGVPSDARAVVLNVTVVDATAGGNLRLFAQGIAAPLASVINFRAGQVRANNAVVRLSGSPGALTVQTDVPAGSTHAVVDVNGYFR